jgi:hypothetical protein
MQGVLREKWAEKNHPGKLAASVASRATLGAAPGAGNSGWGLAVQTGLHHGPNDKQVLPGPSHAVTVILSVTNVYGESFPKWYESEV